MSRLSAILRPNDVRATERVSRSVRGAKKRSEYSTLTPDYKLALILHPDSSHPSASAEHFATLNKAYKLLSTTASRTSFLQTGYGWIGANPAASPSPGEYHEASADVAMREWARYAKAHGAASWEAGSRARGGFRDSDAGRRAYRAEGFYHSHPGEDFPFHDAPPKGNGDEIFMSNSRFVALLAGLAGIGAWIQYYRMGQVVDNTRDLLVDRHIQ